jgi:hypothetical protein
MNGIPYSPQLLAMLAQNASQQTPNYGNMAPPPYLIKMLSGNAGTGMGNDQRMAAVQQPGYLTQMGM